MDSFKEIRSPEPGALLPPETFRLVGPLVNEARIGLRRIHVDNRSPGLTPLQFLKTFAEQLFNLLAPLELAKHTDVAAMQKAIDCGNGGIGELVLQYADFVHEKARRGPLPLSWHIAIQGHIEGLADELEREWWREGVGHSSSTNSQGPPVSPGQDAELSESEHYTRVNTQNAARIANFIRAIHSAHGIRITKTMIWQVAGYSSRTDFEQYQREDPATTGHAKTAFNRILRMTPEAFIAEARRRGVIK
jgi:hypothetical protein